MNLVEKKSHPATGYTPRTPLRVIVGAVFSFRLQPENSKHLDCLSPMEGDIPLQDNGKTI